MTEQENAAVQEAAGREHLVPPSPELFLRSLRSLSYTPETAVADLLDNSVAAGATKINIQFEGSGSEFFIAISDNGSGMNKEELLQAMSFGRRDSLAKRLPSDLGRYGMGMKTASFSLAKALTVISEKDGVESSLYWDLDNVGDWAVHEGCYSAGSAERVVKIHEKGKGTTLILDNVDRFYRDEASFKSGGSAAVERIRNHIEMVFHRFLDKSYENAPDVTITINGRKLVPMDPLFTGHPLMVFSRGPDPIPNLLQPLARVRVCVLPPPQYLTEKEKSLFEGVSGSVRHEGFYVYRNNRIVVDGSWLNLRRTWNQDEANKLVRISIDIDNSHDEEWQLDVLKSQVSVPDALRDSLVRMAKDARMKSRESLMGHRTPAKKESVSPVWISVTRSDGSEILKINRECPKIAEALKNSKAELEPVLRMIEQKLPVQQILVIQDNTNTGEKARKEVVSGDEREEVLSGAERDLARNIRLQLRDMTKAGMTLDDAIEKMKRSGPYREHLDLLDRIYQELKKNVGTV